MANVPSTFPALDLIGTDQQARKPYWSASSLLCAHNGSVTMSETITRSPLCAAAPQGVVRGPMSIPSMAWWKLSGRLGAAPCRRCLPSSSSTSTEQNRPSACASIAPTSASRTSGRGRPRAIISRTALSLARTPWVPALCLMSTDRATCAPSLMTFAQRRGRTPYGPRRTGRARNRFWPETHPHLRRVHRGDTLRCLRASSSRSWVGPLSP